MGDPLSASSDSLWSFFVAGALGLTILVVALGAAVVIAQRRYFVLHRAFARRLLAATDEERADVAREVHDNAVQQLSMASNALQLVTLESRGLSAEERERLEELRSEVQDLGASLRKLAYRLHPRTLERGKLKESLEQLAGDMAEVFDLHVELDCEAAERIHDSARVQALFRIAQEALRNVGRHARTETASLSLTLGDGNATLVVRDGGRGFDQDARSEGAGRSGLGLLAIQERARLVAGKASIVSRPGEGTIVRVTVPLREPA